MQVHTPQDETGWRELSRRVAGAHADAVRQALDQLDCPPAQKRRLLADVLRRAQAGPDQAF